MNNKKDITSLLDKINNPKDLKKLKEKQFTKFVMKLEIL